MGGLAFSGGPDALHTPRMPRAVYEAVRERCHAVLRELFVAVATPIEGPGKTDHGDVDVLVAVAREAAVEGGDHGRLGEAARRLGAVRAIWTPGKATLAVPWPRLEGADEDEAEDEAEDEDEAAAAAAFVQVDLTELPSLAGLHWALFKHAHGDLWNVLGMVLRPLGLTADETALWLRVPEIERAHRRRARVFLTSEPADVLHFLGLPLLSASSASSASLWEQPFADASSLFAYIAQSPLFVPPPRSCTADDPLGMAVVGASDRRLFKYRPLVRQWAAEFVPAYRRGMAASALLSSSSPTRASVRAAAFARFPGVQARYQHTLADWLAEQRARDVWAAAKAAVPSGLPGRYRSAACAAVRRRLEAAEGPPDDILRPEPPDLSAADARLPSATGLAAWTVGGAVAFVTAHWQTLAAAAAPAEHAYYLRSKEEQNTKMQTQDEAETDK